jgi:dGTPase
LNLTLAVREGIVKHSRDYSAQEHPELAAYFLDRRPPLEAQLIDLADEIAYLTADLDDGMEAEILTLEQIRSGVNLFERYFAPLAAKHPGAPEKLLFQEALKLMLNALADDLVVEIRRRLVAEGIRDLEGIRRAPERLAVFSPEIEQLRWEAKEFLYRNLYLCEDMASGHRQAAQVIADLFAEWMADPSLLPPGYFGQVEEEGAARVIADYIAGMTDHFVLKMHRSVRKMVVPGRQ